MIVWVVVFGAASVACGVAVGHLLASRSIGLEPRTNGRPHA